MSNTTITAPVGADLRHDFIFLLADGTDYDLSAKTASVVLTPPRGGAAVTLTLGSGLVASGYDNRVSMRVERVTKADWVQGLWSGEVRVVEGADDDILHTFYVDVCATGLPVHGETTVYEGESIVTLGSRGPAGVPWPGDGDTVTVSTPLFDLEQTWNNAAVAFTGLRANFINTASLSASLLLALQVSGVDTFTIRRDGLLTTLGGAAFGAAVTIAGGTVWHSGNDGAGSGLDADLLDGQSSAFYLDAGNLNAGTLPAARMPALTGDVTSAAGAVATTLATVNVNIGSFGSATKATTFTVNAKGLLTAAGEVTITPAWASVTNTPTTAAGYGLTDVWTTATLRSDNAAPWNFFVGYDSGSAITSGTENLGIGPRALASLTSGTGNLGIGHSALGSLQDGINNTAIGWDSQFVNVSGTNNVSLGEDALKYVLGDNNTGLGYTAGYSISTGDRNVAIAPVALYNVTTGDYNIGIGYGAGATLIGASSHNVIIGQAAYQGGAGTVCTGNTIIGDTAGYYATGSRNVFLGAYAGTSLTLSDRLVIDDRDRGSEANVIAKALLYGVFADTVAGQSLNVNADLNANGNVSLITDAATLKLGAAADVVLARDAANILAMRNGAAGQIGRWYNTHTDAANGEWMSIGAGIAGLGTNTFGIFLGANGTGNTTRPLYIGTAGAGLVGFVTSGTTRWSITSAGHWNANTHNSYDFGAPANAARTGYFGRSLIVGGETATVSTPLLNLTQTWNAGAVTFTADLLNITDTASAAASLLIDRQVGGVSKFSVRKDGFVTAAQFAFGSNDYLTTASSFIVARVNGGDRVAFGPSGQLAMRSDGLLQWSSTTSPYGTADLLVVRDAANTWAQRNGANAQTFNLYGTYTDASNYERLSAFWSGGTLYLQTRAAGTGAARELSIGTQGNAAVGLRTNDITRWYVSGSSGSLFALADNTYDIGASGATRPRSVYVGTNIIAGNNIQTTGAFNWPSKCHIVCSTDGILTFYNNAQTGFDRLQFGGVTPSFPALKRSATVLQARLADDSDFAPLQGKLRTQANAVAETPAATHTMIITDASGTAYRVLCCV